MKWSLFWKTVYICIKTEIYVALYTAFKVTIYLYIVFIPINVPYDLLAEAVLVWERLSVQWIVIFQSYPMTVVDFKCRSWVIWTNVMVFILFFLTVKMINDFPFLWKRAAPTFLVVFHGWMSNNTKPEQRERVNKRWQNAWTSSLRRLYMARHLKWCVGLSATQLGGPIRVVLFWDYVYISMSFC